MKHPPELLEFMADLHRRGIAMINSAVFNAGFLAGGAYFDYRIVSEECEKDRPLFRWRNAFFTVCERHGVNPAEACVKFGMSVPGVLSVALNTGRPRRVAQNVAAVQADIPTAFWAGMKEAGLVAADYPYLG